MAPNLTRVTFPDSGSRLYHYEDARHPTYLTGISLAGTNHGQQLTQRTGTCLYNIDGKAILKVRGEPA